MKYSTAMSAQIEGSQGSDVRGGFRATVEGFLMKGTQLGNKGVDKRGVILAKPCIWDSLETALVLW